MYKKLVVIICFSILLSGVILFYCKLPEAPAGPEEAKVSLLFKSSDGKIDEAGSITDSVGKEVQIGIVLHLTHYIDSSVVRVFFGDSTERIFPWKFKSNIDDTVFFPITFTITGTRVIEATAYISDQLNSVAKGKITILGPPLANNKPDLKVPVTQTAGVGQAVSFPVSASDQDADQTVTISITKKPENATFAADSFKWTPSISDTGTVAVVFVATDNGIPAMSDTDSVTIHVSATQVNHAPQWNPKNIQRTIKPGVLFSYDLSITCSDPDNDSLTFSLIPASPVNDTIVSKNYSFTPSASDTGKHAIRILAKDPSGLTDTLTLGLTVSTVDVPDNVPPVIKIQSPSKDTVISVDSFEINVICSDDSGCSVKGFRNGGTFTLKKSASVKNLWTGMVKGLAAGSYSTIKIVAEDSSKAKNRDSALVRIKYDNDKSGPVITLINPAKDSVTTSSSSYMIVLKVTDPSGVLSINGATGATTFTGVRDTSSVWKINVNALENYKVTAIVLTATDSSLKANKTLDTIYIRSEIVNGYKIKFDKNDSTATGTMAEQTINSGDSAKLSTNAFVKDGSIFSGWVTTPTGTVIAYTDGAIFKMGTSNVTLYAKWIKKASYTLTITATNGSVSKSPDAATYDSGTVVSLTPIPSNNYHFSGWSGAITGTANPATITMNSDKSVTAGFEVNPPNTFSLTVTASNGTVKKTPDLPQYDSGSTVGLKATANTGYKFVNWSGDVTGTSDSTAVVINSGKSVTANFALIPYQLTVAAVNGTVTLPATSTITVNHGVLTSIKAVANTGYSFSKWTVTNGTATITSASAESTTVFLTSGDATVTATFTAIPVTLTLVNDGHGATTPASTASGSYGVPISILAAAAGGYSFSSWTVINGTAVVGNETQANTTVTLTTNATIQANFTAIPVRLTLTNDGNGTTTPANTASGSYGVPITISAAASSGYSFSGWTTTTGTAVFDNASQASTTVTLTANATIRANFTANLLRPINVAATSPVCSGNASTLTASIPSNGTGTLTWYRGSCGGGTAVGTGTSVSSGVLTSDATFYVRAESGGSFSECASVNVTVNQLPTQPTPVTRLVTICPGISTTLSTTSNPPSGVTWQWYMTKTPTSSSQALGSLNVTPISTSTYYVRGETSSCGNSAWDSTMVVVRSVSSVSSITADPSDNICGGSSVTLTVNGVLGEGAAWHWYSGSCGGVPEGIGSSITKKISSSMLFYVRAEGGCNQTGCVFKQISRKSVPIITGTQGFTRVDDIDGSAYRLYVNATPTTQTDELYYQWYKNDVPMTGYNSNMTYVFLPDGVGIWYCAVTSGETGCTVKAEPCSLFVSNP